MTVPFNEMGCHLGCCYFTASAREWDKSKHSMSHIYDFSGTIFKISNRNIYFLHRKVMFTVKKKLNLSADTAA